MILSATILTRFRSPLGASSWLAARISSRRLHKSVKALLQIVKSGPQGEEL